MAVLHSLKHLKFHMQNHNMIQEHDCMYSLCFKIKVTFGHKLRYEIKVMFGEISLKLRQTNWNVARNNVNVVVDELPSQITHYTCSTIDIWTRRR
jgi:hypothetical protein